MPATYDAIVIGAGVNGLTAAACLAKAGLRVLVLERRSAEGGCASTEEMEPGFRVDPCVDDAGWVSPALVDGLELEREGLQLLRSEATVFAPLPGGGHLSLSRDVGRTAESIARFSRGDAARWSAFSARVARLAGFLELLYDAPAPRPVGGGLDDLLRLAALGRRLRALGKTEMVELLRTLPMSVAELLDDWFEGEALKGVLGAGGIRGVFQGPRAGGTAFALLHHHVGEGPGGIRARTAVRGGTGQLARALAAAARRYGAVMRCGAEVIEITVADGRACGVVVHTGERFAARRVVSSADPRRTFLQLTDPVHLDPEFVRAVQHIKLRGACARVNLALGELPRFTGLGGDQSAALRGVISISPSLDYLERAYDDAKYGGISRRPYLEATIPSLGDPTLSPPGRHVMSITMQYAPYRLRDGPWDRDRREALGDTVIETLAEYAPNLPGAILHRQVLTPKDIEEVYGLTEGNLDQGELTLDQILFMRPVPGWSRYRTPIRDLFLCGSGTHPGGRVAGGAGRLAAREILSHRR